MLAVASITFSTDTLEVVADYDDDTLAITTQHDSGTDYVALNGNLVGASGGWATGFGDALDASTVQFLNVDGGEGSDTIDFTGITSTAFSNWSRGLAVGNLGDDVVYGSPLFDYLDGGSGNDTLYGYGGTDELYGGYDENLQTWYYNEYDEWVSEGSNDFDYLDAGDGDDHVYGGNADNAAYGGNGNDRIWFNGQNDTAYGGDGNDQVSAGSQNNTVYGDGGDDLLQAWTGNDALYGGNGNDTIDSSYGEDWLYGGDGDDVLDGGEGNDSIDGGNNEDTMYGGAGDDTLEAGGGNDTLYGADGNDALSGGDGNDQIYGGDGNDYEVGGNGDDALYGGDGTDAIDGGPGANYQQPYIGFWVGPFSGSGSFYDDGGCPGCYSGENRVDGYSSTGNPHPLIARNVSFSSGASSAALIRVDVSIGGLAVAPVYYDPSTIELGEAMRVAVQVDATTLETGRYAVTMTVTEDYAGAPDVVHTFPGYKDVVNRIDSEFGNRRLPVDVDRIVIYSTGLLLVQNDNQTYWFKKELDGSFTAEDQEPGFSTIEYNSSTGAYTLTQKDASQRTFNSLGYIVSRKDTRGREVTYTYGSMDNDLAPNELVSRVDDVGRATSFSYTDGLVSSLTDFAGRTTTFNYDNRLLVSRISPDPDGSGPLTAPETTYTYDPATGLLESVTNAEGETTLYTYRADRTLETTTYADGTIEQLFAALSQGLLIPGESYGSMTTPGSFVAFDDIVGVTVDKAGEEWKSRFDAFGNLVAKIDPLGNVTQYTRNSHGSITEVTLPDPDGGGPLTQLTMEFEYDSKGNLLEQTNPDGSTRSWTYDSTWNTPNSFVDELGRVTLRTLDALTGDVLEERRVVGLNDLASSETDDVVVTYTYTPAPTLGTDPPAGLVASIEDANGVVTLFEYNAHGLVTKITYADGTSVEAYVEYEYDGADNIISRKDELGRETEYEFDDLDRLVTLTLPDPDGVGAGFPLTSPVYTFEYDNNGRLTKAIDPLSRSTEYVFNSSGQLEEVIAPDHDGDTAGSTTTNVYDPAGRLKEIVDALGRTGDSKTFDELGRVTKVTGAAPGGVGAGPEYLVSYGALDWVLSATDPLGNTVEYSYSDFGNTITTTHPDPETGLSGYGPESTLVRDSFGNVISSTDALGRVTTYEYDELNRLVTVTGPDPTDDSVFNPPVTEYSYDNLGRLISETDPLGNTSGYEYDERGRLLRITRPDPDGAGPSTAPETEYEYDDAGQMVLFRNALGFETKYAYDNLGRLASRTDPDPDGAGPLSGPTTTYGYDSVDNLVKVTNPGGETQYQYDWHDNLTKITQPDPDGGGSLSSPIWEFTYDDLGNRLTATDPRGNTRSFEYDDLNRLVQDTIPDPDGVGAGLAPRTNYEYDLAGNLLTSTDRLSQTTTYVYDHLNRRVSSKNPNNEETAFSYDAVGNLLTFTDPELNTTTWTYDALNRVTKETNELGKDRVYTYDSAGNLTQKEDRLGRLIIYEYDHLNRQTAEKWLDGPQPTISSSEVSETYHWDEIQGGIGYTTTNAVISGTFTLTFDGQTTAPIAWNASNSTILAALEALSNIDVGDITMLYGAGSSTYWSMTVNFGGNYSGVNVPQISIDASGIYDGYGPATETAGGSMDGYTIGETQELTGYSYGGWSGGTYTLTFEGETTSALDWDASAGEVESALEALPNIDDVTVSMGMIGYQVTFGGSLAGRDVEPITGDASNLVNGSIGNAIYYSYDSSGNLVQVTDSFADYTFTRDSLGRTVNFIQDIAGLLPQIKFESTFDAAGQRAQLQSYFDSTKDFKNTYSYDEMQRLTSISQQSASGGNAIAPKFVEFTYNENGQYSSISRYAATSAIEFVAASYLSYDGSGRIRKLVHSESATPPSSGWGIDPLAGYEYEYDAGNRITSIDSYIDGLSEFTHDYVGQLTAADHASASDETYEYDSNGNRVMSGYIVNDNNQVLSDGAFNYTFDDEGNRLTRTKISNGYVTRYEWDARNRLTKVTEEDDLNNVLQVTTNSYDALNQWIRWTFDADGQGMAPPVDTFFIYENGQIVLQFDGDDDSDLSHRYLWGARVDLLLSDEAVTSLGSAGAVIWPLGDSLNTLRDLVTYDSGTDDASIVNHREYDSFGNLSGESNSVVDLLFGYTGRLFDAATGLQNNLNRWYDPTIGRWVSEDPIGFRGDTGNLNRYVGNSPLSIVDPSGLGFFNDYWYYLTNPGAMDDDLETGFYVAAGTAAVAGVAAGGVVAAGYGGVVVIGGGSGTAAAGGAAAGTGTVIVGGSTTGGAAAAGTGTIIVGGSTTGGAAAAGTGTILVGAGTTSGAVAAGTGTLTVAAPAVGLGTSATVVSGAGVVGSGVIITGAGIMASSSFETGIIGSMAATSPYWGQTGWSALNVVPASHWSWTMNVGWLYRMWYLGTPILCRPGGPVTAQELQWLANHGYVRFGDLLVRIVP